MVGQERGGWYLTGGGAAAGGVAEEEEKEAEGGEGSGLPVSLRRIPSVRLWR